jgi:hypothetical protein
MLSLEGLVLTSEERKRVPKSPYYLDTDTSTGTDLGMISTGFTVSDVGSAILLLILVVGGVFALVYFVGVAFLNLITFGELHRASVYSSKVKRYSIGESKGYTLARGLTKLNIYFSIVLTVFTAEEVIRYLLHTGPATLEIWYFRIACLAIIAAILVFFYVRLRRWMSFKVKREFVEASNEITQQDEIRRAMHEKRASTGKALKPSS